MHPLTVSRKAVLTGKRQIGARLVALVGLMRDVLDEETGRLKPLSALLLLGAAILAAMISYNAMFAQHIDFGPHLAVNGQTDQSGLSHVDGAVPADPANTIVIKYDPVVEDVQRALLVSGIYHGQVDGVNGQRTKSAIAEYQQANGLPVTGEVSKELATHIQYTNKLKAASEFTGSVEPASLEVPILTQSKSKPALQSANEDGKSELGATTLKNSISLAPAINAKQLRIKRVQIALSSLGYKAGKVTGSLNESTKSAILKFEMDNGLAMDGVVNSKLLQALQITSSN